MLGLFLWIESRVADPIVHLPLFRIRAFTVSVVAMFMAAFGFFGAVIFLPRYFQAVEGASATESGYSLLPLLAALIVSATASGQIVARTHRYKVLIFVSMVLLGVGLWLLTHLEAGTDRPVLWAWMIVAGLGIGPSFAVFTLIVQNAVQPQLIGVATSSLTFFQQIGGTVGLTIAGTIFASRLTDELPARLIGGRRAGAVRRPVRRAAGGLDIAGTGDLGTRILAATPPAQQAFVQPLIPGIVAAVHDSISIAIASSFWVGIIGAIIGAVVVLFIDEVPMRATFEMTETEPA